MILAGDWRRSARPPKIVLLGRECQAVPRSSAVPYALAGAGREATFFERRAIRRAVYEWSLSVSLRRRGDDERPCTNSSPKDSKKLGDGWPPENKVNHHTCSRG